MQNERKASFFRLHRSATHIIAGSSLTLTDVRTQRSFKDRQRTECLRQTKNSVLCRQKPKCLRQTKNSVLCRQKPECLRQTRKQCLVQTKNRVSWADKKQTNKQKTECLRETRKQSVLGRQKQKQNKKQCLRLGRKKKSFFWQTKNGMEVLS